jgi:hypothetical protein
MVPIDIILLFVSYGRHGFNTLVLIDVPYWVWRPSLGIAHSNSDPLVFHGVKPYSTEADQRIKSKGISILQ